jgi:FkbM family methyltransferase
MSIVNKTAARLQRLDRRLWPEHRVVLAPSLRSALLENKLIVADIGAASGPETRWMELADCVHFLTFEPVERHQPGTSSFPSATNFKTGLGAERKTAVLRIMKDTDASTLCEVHQENIGDFAIGDGLQPVGSLPLEVDALDNILGARPELSPHYLKVDVEGADLDVLKGCARALDSTVMAVRVEVSFLERHRGAPFFGDTDRYMREHGFQLFQLSKELWIRRNMVHGYSSEPQLAWGDAVYFLRQEPFLNRLRDSSPTKRNSTLLHFTLILLSFGVHDYAVEILEAAKKADFASADLINQLEDAVRASVDRSSLFLLKSFAGMVFGAGIYVLTLPVSSARLRTGYYLKQRAGVFFRLMARRAGKSGPSGSCISE